MSPPRLEIAPGCFADVPDNVVPLSTAESVDEAWNEWIALVDQRHARNLWKDAEHNKRMARAWERWRRLYLMTEHAS